LVIEKKEEGRRKKEEGRGKKEEIFLRVFLTFSSRI